MQKEFEIESIDPLGQGVSKKDGDIFFIKKTLPGEIGTAEVISSKKGVHFGILSELKVASQHRIKEKCPHFSRCNGCDFLHTDYANELEFKKSSAMFSLKFLNVKEVIAHGAKNRFHYRNRLQLHYNLKERKLGFFDQKHKIVEVPECLIPTPEIVQKLKELYKNNFWTTLLKNQPATGHIEIYSQSQGLKISVNEAYASGGFTQVNQEMNDYLQEFLQEKIKSLLKPNEVVFDLFGGNGNLTAKIENPALVVDHYPRLPNNTFRQIFFHQDLYGKNALKNIKNFYSKNPDLIIFDPPRSGLTHLAEFLETFSPKHFIYISCQFSSFTRDAKTALTNYQLNEVHLIDLFPGTHHFETVGIFTKSNNPS